MLASIGKGHYAAAFDTGIYIFVPSILEAKCPPPPRGASSVLHKHTLSSNENKFKTFIML